VDFSDVFGVPEGAGRGADAKKWWCTTVMGVLAPAGISASNKKGITRIYNDGRNPCYSLKIVE